MRNANHSPFGGYDRESHRESGEMPFSYEARDIPCATFVDNRSVRPKNNDIDKTTAGNCKRAAPSESSSDHQLCVFLVRTDPGNSCALRVNGLD